MIINTVSWFYSVVYFSHPRTQGYRDKRQWVKIKQLWTLESDRFRSECQVNRLLDDLVQILITLSLDFLICKTEILITIS